MSRSSTETLIAAMRVLAVDIQSEDGVANAAIAEAAERLLELRDALEKAQKFLAELSRPEENDLGVATSVYWARCIEIEKEARAALDKARGK
ncbi:MAG: hypothetical protein EOM21_18545 [Gammaproteobacteria bacterium]|nr:hypothetical protein [Gammaproteobacteria bacterium]